jgi:hypothetical protein
MFPVRRMHRDVYQSNGKVIYFCKNELSLTIIMVTIDYIDTYLLLSIKSFRKMARVVIYICIMNTAIQIHQPCFYFPDTSLKYYLQL